MRWRTLVAPEFGSQRIDQLTTEQVDELLADLGQQSVNRQRKAKEIVGAMLDIAVARRVIEDLDFEIDLFAGIVRGRLARDPG